MTKPFSQKALPKTKGGLYQCCKMCGLPLPQRFIAGDFDYTQYHAWLYHFDIVDSYDPQEVRQLIENGHIDKEGVSEQK